MHKFSVCQMHRTFSNVLETQYCKELNKISGWFDFTEPHRNTSLKALLVHDSSGASNLLDHFELHYCKDTKVCKVSKHVFEVVQQNRTFTRHTFKGEARCAA